MTIISEQTLLPTRFSINVTENRSAKPPPNVYTIYDNRFKGVQPRYSEGYEESRANPDTSAIVIDNGESPRLGHALN